MGIRHSRETDDRYAVNRIYEKSWRYACKNIIPWEYLESIPKGQWAQGIDAWNRVIVKGR